MVLESNRAGVSMRPVKPLLPLALLPILLGSCAKQAPILEVKTFQLRDESRKTTSDPMVRMEKGRLLRGAVSMEERRQRLGQYYTLIWNDPNGAGTGEVEVVFEYQQGATASQVKRMTRTFPATDTHGTADFSVIGDDYFKGGKVLAWKAIVSRGGRELESRQSYLWR